MNENTKVYEICIASMCLCESCFPWAGCGKAPYAVARGMANRSGKYSREIYPGEATEVTGGIVTAIKGGK